MSDQNKKIRILALCDSPTTATGFAQVSRNILRGLAATGKYEIDVIGINYTGDYYDRNVHPYNIFPAMPLGYNDVYGRSRFIRALNGEEINNGLTPPWDIVFTIQDPFVLEGLGLSYPWAEQIKVSEQLWRRTLSPELWFTWVAYWPVDADLKENWVTRSIALPNYPVAYCEWGKDEMLKWDRRNYRLKFNFKPTKDAQSTPAVIEMPSLDSRIKVIPHGVDLNTFKILPESDRKSFREKFFGGMVKDDTYLVINVSRNQPRKDLTRTLKVFSEFKKKVPNAHLYLHCKLEDAGGSIDEMARNFKLVPGQDYSVPKDFSANSGFTVEIVNQIYNAADLCITTTLGEGWGFITTEAMATRTPIIGPNITSLIDIFGTEGVDYSIEMLNNSEWRKKIRGIPVKAGSTSSEWICQGLEDNERIRPLTNVDDMVEKMLWVYNHPNETLEIINNAYAWIQNLDWPKVVAQWDQLITEAYTTLQSDRLLGERIDKAGRNDPCPCGSGLKFKKCHFLQDAAAKVQDWIKNAQEIPA